MTTRKPQVGDYIITAEQHAAYEAAVEALERLAHYTDAAAECHGTECNHGKWLREETDRARAALARLRDNDSEGSTVDR